MDIFSPIMSGLIEVWYIVPLLLVAAILKSKWWKGVFGEIKVNRILSSLPSDSYALIKDVTLPTDDGTTQVDHIVVSKFGVFVIETKNMTGWIFGSARQKQWTQKIYRHTSKFQNPIHQNYKHLKTLQSLLRCKDDHLHSVVVFVGDSVFKTQMPSNVTYSDECLSYIKGFNEVVFSNEEYIAIVELIAEVKLRRGIITDLNHRQHVKEIVAKKSK